MVMCICVPIVRVCTHSTSFARVWAKPKLLYLLKSLYYGTKAPCCGGVYKYKTNVDNEQPVAEQFFEVHTKYCPEWDSNPGHAAQCKASRHTLTTMPRAIIFLVT